MIVERGCMCDDGRGAKFKIAKRLQFKERDRGSERGEKREGGQGNNQDEKKGDWRIIEKMKKKKRLKLFSTDKREGERSNGDMIERRETQKKINQVV